MQPRPAAAAEKLTSEQVSALLPQLFKLHLKQGGWDVPFVKRLLKKFVEEVDPMKNFYTKQEADDIINLSDDQLKQLAEQASNGDFSYFEKTFKTFLDTQIGRDNAFYAGLDNKLNDVKVLLKEKSDKLAAKTNDKSDKSSKPDAKPVAETNPLNEKADPKNQTASAQTAENKDPDEDDAERVKWTERPVSNAEREQRVLKELSVFFESNKTYLSENDAFKLAVQTVREEREKWLKVKADDEVPKIFLKSFMDAMDPHTNYFDAEEDEFTERLEREFAGIGVQIRPCPLGAQVEDVIKGGPSDKSGKFAPGDQIIAVDNVPLAGLPINKIVKRIKGEKGTDVTLRVLKKSTTANMEVTLKRDTIQLADMKVKGKTFNTPAGTMGLISVQTFYRGVHNDVRDRINELSKNKPLAGLVLDLRDNHGGYLEEAVGLAGLFLNNAPVVGERDGSGRVDWRSSEGDAAYTGPLVVLTNQFSASASEIVAGTLKDYSRCLIVAPTQTFGKGTVQRVIPLSSLNLPGEIKITTHQYFLASGDSVQLRGVLPDVVIPGAKLMEEEGYLERASENAVPFNHIKGKIDKSNTDAQLWSQWKTQQIAAIQQKSKGRIDNNQEIKDFFDIKKRKAKALALAAEQEAKKLNPDQAPTPPDPNKEEKDPQADEAISILQDMVPTWPTLDKQAAK